MEQSGRTVVVGRSCAIMFSCLDCRKALIAKSKSHSEISYDGGKFRDGQEQLTGDDRSNDTSAVTGGQQRQRDDGEDEEEQSYPSGHVLDGLRRSQTQVRGSAKFN